MKTQKINPIFHRSCGEAKAFVELFILFLFGLLGGQITFADMLTVDAALSRAMQANPEVAASAARADSEHAAIRSQYWLDNPRIGLMRENNLNLMESQMGPMNLWSVTQEVKFPTKYFLMGSMQAYRAEGADYQHSAKRFEIRKKVISTYYGLFAASRIISLLEAQKETTREVARSAESRRATGAVPQQDEMKAHVEQTRIEAELVMASQEKTAVEASLNALLNQEASEPIVLPSQELPVPMLNVTAADVPKLAMSSSRQIKAAEAFSEEAGKKKALAAWNFAPDFALSYKKAWTSAPQDNYAIGVEISFPLWFFMKQTSEYSSAAALLVEAEKNLEKANRDTSSEVRSLSAKVDSFERLLKIYQTSLIPQANSALNSSRTAYQAGKVNFLELLDSERSLYSVRIAYYRTLAQYVEYLTNLEEVAGTRLSTLPFGDVL